MKTHITVKEFEQKNKDNMRKIISRLDSLSNSSVSIGFFPSSVYPDGTPVAYIAQVHNEGRGNNPERPFFTKGILIGRMTSESLTQEMLAGVVAGDITVRQYLAQVGTVYQDAIVQAIDSDMPPPNESRYWERKMMKGLKKSGRRKFRAMKAEGRDYLEALKEMDEKYESGKQMGKYKYRAGGAGSPKTLIDTGIMRKAVSYRVEVG